MPEAKAKKIADRFNRQYTTHRPHASKKSSRVLARRIRLLSLEDTISFTTAQVQQAIRESRNSKAFGPDDICIIYLKHLGPRGIEYLTAIYNLSLQTCNIPSIWKMSTIVPLLKPGKDSSDSKSYRPVSLLCPASKVLERLVLPTIKDQIIPKEHQHGFRPKQSTITALHAINDKIATGFNQQAAL